MESEKILIRHAVPEDLDQIAAVEAACFPAAEAATEESFRGRLAVYADHFWLLFLDSELVSFVDGFVTDEPDLTDVMYEEPDMHDPNGAWQMIFGVNTMPQYRKRGYAGMLIRAAIDDARKARRKGVVLTCKKELLKFYEQFGFQNEGISTQSTHGGAVWYQMRLIFN